MTDSEMVEYHIVSLNQKKGNKVFDKQSVKYEGLLSFGQGVDIGAICMLCPERAALRDVLFSYSHEGLPFKKFYLEKPEPKLPWFKVYEGKNKKGVSGWYVEGILYPKDGETRYKNNPIEKSARDIQGQVPSIKPKAK